MSFPGRLLGSKTHPIPWEFLLLLVSLLVQSGTPSPLLPQPARVSIHNLAAAGPGEPLPLVLHPMLPLPIPLPFDLRTLHRLPPRRGGAGLPLPLPEDHPDGEDVGGDGERGPESNVGLLVVGLGGEERTPAEFLAFHVEGADFGDGEAVHRLEAAANVDLRGGGDSLDGEFLDGGQGRRGKHELDGEVRKMENAAAQPATHGAAVKGGRRGP